MCRALCCGEDYVMAIGLGSLIEVVFNMQIQNQEVLNVWQYQVEFWPVSITPVQFLEAYWNHVKAAYRGVFASNLTNAFETLRVRELNNPVGDYAEFDIPSAERTGT